MSIEGRSTFDQVAGLSLDAVWPHIIELQVEQLTPLDSPVFWAVTETMGKWRLTREEADRWMRSVYLPLHQGFDDLRVSQDNAQPGTDSRGDFLYGPDGLPA